MMKQFVFRRAMAVATALVLVGSVVGCSSSTEAPDPAASTALGEDNTPSGDPIIIGADIDSTGPSAAYNVNAQTGIELAVEATNRAGGLLDRPIKLVVGNSASDPAKAPSVYNSLIDQGAIAVVGYPAVGIPPVKSIIQDAQLLTIAAASTSGALVSEAPNDFLYNILPGADKYAAALCGAIDEIGAKKVALFHDDAPGVLLLVEAYKEFIVECLPGGFSTEETAPLNSSDFTAAAARISESNPDAILTVSVGGTFQAGSESAFAQIMPGVQRFAIGTFESQPDAWKVATPGALDGLVAFRPFTDSNPRLAELSTELATLKPGATLDQATILGYVSAMAIINAIERAGTAEDPVAVNKAFQQTVDWLTPLGQKDFTMSWAADKHTGADNECALVLMEFGADNTVSGEWDGFQPVCN